MAYARRTNVKRRTFVRKYSAKKPARSKGRSKVVARRRRTSIAQVVKKVLNQREEKHVHFPDGKVAVSGQYDVPVIKNYAAVDTTVIKSQELCNPGLGMADSEDAKGYTRQGDTWRHLNTQIHYKVNLPQPEKTTRDTSSGQAQVRHNLPTYDDKDTVVRLVVWGYKKHTEHENPTFTTFHPLDRTSTGYQILHDKKIYLSENRTQAEGTIFLNFAKGKSVGRKIVEHPGGWLPWSTAAERENALFMSILSDKPTGVAAEQKPHVLVSMKTCFTP